MKKFLLTGAAMVSLTSAASASITLTLAGTSGSSIVSYQFSGSGTYTGLGATLAEVTISTLTGAIFDDSVGAGDKIFAASGLFSNDTTASSVAINQFVLDQDVGAVDDYEFQFSSITFNAGDAYSISGSGNVDLSSVSLTFDDLNIGNYSDSTEFEHIDFGGIELVIVEAVPEPSSALLLGLGGMGMLFRRRRA